MSVSFRAKDQSQAASHSPLYSGVAEATVQPAVGVRGGVTARCGSFEFVASSLENQLRKQRVFFLQWLPLAASDCFPS